ncbi:hypothetical protein TNIN_312841 [Trichonephila inaurata madagascariensis]|uniref:Uncharacterized protein n=1 Tax=Trichonephila inaurata madagascariensis TaxID=2747483 RepID=A0A8X6YNE9_9ARAC|nr:hypothetical protein TNIN_312841 [Trichonephila inaurata madagascariensis]
MKEKAARVFQKLTQDFQNCLKQWHMSMEDCRDRGDVHIEGDNKPHLLSSEIFPPEERNLPRFHSLIYSHE